MPRKKKTQAPDFDADAAYIRYLTETYIPAAEFAVRQEQAALQATLDMIDDNLDGLRGGE